MSVYMDGSDCTCLDDEDEHRNTCPASPNYDGPDDSYWEAERWAPRVARESYAPDLIRGNDGRMYKP